MGSSDGGGIERFASGGPWEERFGYSRAVRAGELVFVAGTTAVDEDGVVRGIGDAGEQTAYVLERIADALAAAGARMDQVVRTRMFVTDISRGEEIGRAHGAAQGRARRTRAAQCAARGGRMR